MTPPTPAPREAREPGRELDALVAEQVIGAMWSNADDVARAACSMRRMRGTPKQTLTLPSGRVLCWRSASGAMLITDDGPGDNLPHYSTDIAAAWEVVEAMARHSTPWMVTLKNWNYYSDRTYTATFTTHPLGPPPVEATAATPELAICLAALSARETGQQT